MVPSEAPHEAELRQRILEHARQRFLAEGFVSVSVDDLCRDLGISKKTFYKIFPSKEDLLRQEAEMAMRDVHAFIGGLLANNKSFAEKVLELSTTIATIASQISRTLIRDLQRHAPELWKRIEQFRSKTLQTNFLLLVEQGMQEGYVRRDLNLRVFLLAYAAAIDQIMTPSVLSVEQFSAIEAINNIFGIFFHGILTEQGRSLIIPKAPPSFTRNQQSAL